MDDIGAEKYTWKSAYKYRNVTVALQHFYCYEDLLLVAVLITYFAFVCATLIWNPSAPIKST